MRAIIEEVDEQQHEIGQKCLAILDSGSDVSLLPMQFGGRTEENCNVQLRDCQGGALKVLGQQNAALLVQSAQGEEIELQHRFAVGDVKHCILSLGELYRGGWHVQPGDPLYLTSPKGTVQIPVKFQQNSFAIEASVCRIEHGLEEPTQDLAVRAVMRVADAFNNFVRFGLWETEKDCPYTTRLGTTFVDPRPKWSVNFPYRTTLIKRVSEANNEWCVCEVSKLYLQLEDPYGPIAEIATHGRDEQCMILTILPSVERSLSFFGALLDGAGLDVEQSMAAVSEDVEERRGADAEIGGAAETSEIVGQDIPEFQQLAPALGEIEASDSVIVGGMELTQNSSVASLRQAAGLLGISSSGSKAKIFRKIKAAHVESIRQRAAVVAHEPYLEARGPQPRFQDSPAQASEAERKRHEATHLPTKPWCPHCAKGKSKHPTKLEGVALRMYPIIQCDCFFSTKQATLASF